MWNEGMMASEFLLPRFRHTSSALPGISLARGDCFADQQRWQVGAKPETADLPPSGGDARQGRGGAVPPASPKVEQAQLIRDECSPGHAS